MIGESFEVETCKICLGKQNFKNMFINGLNANKLKMGIIEKELNLSISINARLNVFVKILKMSMNYSIILNDITNQKRNIVLTNILCITSFLYQL